MKFLKKASLAASIAAVSFAANAELVAMDEMAMAAATGQAGIDLDITLSDVDAISIGEVLYTDTVDGVTTGGGSLAISNIIVGAADGSDITIFNAIDIDETGSIIMDSSATDLSGLRVRIGNVETRTDAGLSAANLARNVDVTMDVQGGVTTIAQSGTDTTITSVGGSVEVTSGSMTLLNNAIGITDLRVYGTGGVGTGISTDSTLTFNGDGISITGLDLAGTIEIGDLALGGSSIGSVAISDIALNGAAVTISGR